MRAAHQSPEPLRGTRSHRGALVALATARRAPAVFALLAALLFLAPSLPFTGRLSRAEAVAGVPAPATVLPAGAIPREPLGAGGLWTLALDDEFDGPRIDAGRWQSNWFATTRSAVTAPDNHFDLNCADPRQVAQRSGTLALSAVARPCRADNGRSYAYASGIVSTRNSFRFTYGFLEARIWVPSDAWGDPVNFPAFWATGTGHWPASAEIDVMEVLDGCGPGLAYHVHSVSGSAGGCVPLRRPSGWHTFGADWEPAGVTYYYDGRQVGRVPAPSGREPMYLVLDNSIDPHYGGPATGGATMLVDYVRVWR